MNRGRRFNEQHLTTVAFADLIQTNHEALTPNANAGREDRGGAGRDACAVADDLARIPRRDSPQSNRAVRISTAFPEATRVSTHACARSVAPSAADATDRGRGTSVALSLPGEREMSLRLHDLLSAMVEEDASDLYITINSPPLLRVQGFNQPIGDVPLTGVDTEALASSVMSDEERAEFGKSKEMNLGISVRDLGRFRVNVLRQRGSVAMVIRQIKTKIPSLQQMGLPPILQDIMTAKRGLILVTGATGSGKSTSLAAMIGHRNENTKGHIITIEDPIEFMHPNRGCVVTQREVGADTNSFAAALKNTLRQAPDVILIGEIRDAETMEAAITFADTGHLCLGTLHSSNANQTLQRLMNFFAAERHAEIYLQLSMNLRAIISQRLIPGIDGRRVAALEILLGTPWVQDLIKKGEVDRIKEAMERDVNEGCQTFDLALLELYRQGRISSEEAVANADSANNLKIKMTQLDLRQPGPATTSPIPAPVRSVSIGSSLGLAAA
jgi:twitching motility protein PilU